MSDILFRNSIDHRARANNRSVDKLESEIVDELADVRLTDSSEILGGAAEITIGPLAVSFNRVILVDDTLHLKGPLGRTVARVQDDTDLAETILDFLTSNDDIKYQEWEEK